MRLAGSLSLVLLLVFTSEAAGLDIPLEVEQPPTIIRHTPSPVIILPYDNALVISCEARGNPPPQYRWTKDGQEFDFPREETITTGSRNGNFSFHKKHSVQFVGKWRCFASNKLGTAMTEEIEITLLVSPKFPKETFDPVIVKEGEPITLQCNPPKGVPPRLLYWMTVDLRHIEQNERISMGTNGDLFFSYALSNDSRPDYCCVAAFSSIRTIVQKTAMSVKVEKFILISYTVEALPVRAPSLLLPSGVQSQKVLMKGEDLELECFPGGLPTPAITWIKMGENLSDRHKMTNFNKHLSISNVDVNDQGKYMCMAENSAGKAVHYFDVIVQEPPSWITEPPRSQLAVVGSDVAIRCSVSGIPPPAITWSRNGKMFKDDPQSNRRVLDDMVMLHKAESKDSGVYQCEASNSHGTILANINVLVMNMAPLMVTKDSLRYAVIVGGDAVIDCSVFSSPPSDIVWIKEDRKISGERFLISENGQSLKINSTEKGDSGEYVCEARNTEGTSTLTAVLEVKDVTKIVGRPQDVQIISGTSAQLMCQVEYDESLRDTFEVVWRKDEEILLSSEEDPRYNVTGGWLQIMNVNLRDEGRYTCIAKTNLDQDSASALLTVLDIPDAPTMLKISDVKSERNIVLSWEPGSDHNVSITEFVVEYEEDRWEPGSWKELQKVAGNQTAADLFLPAGLNYHFRVYSVNAIGPGPPSEPTERYTTPPAAPDKNPENIRIEGSLPHQMDISWEPLSPIEYNGNGLEYIVTYRKLGVEDDWKVVMVKEPRLTVKNTPTFIPYEIKVQSRNSFGSGPKPKSVTGYSGEDVPTAAPRDVAVEVINSTAVRVSWTPVPAATVRGHLGGYNVYCMRMTNLLDPDKTVNVSNTMSFPGNRSHVIVPGLKPFSAYKLAVSVFNKKGKGPKSDPVTFNTPEGVPESVPILTISNYQEDSALLVWGPPTVMNGFLSGYILHYHLLNETSLEVIESQETNVTGADITQWKLSGLKDSSRYLFHLSACTQTGCGPPLAQEILTPPTTDYQKGAITTQSWLIGTLCAVALLTLVAIMACFVLKNKGGKYAGTPPSRHQDMVPMEKVKEKEDLYPDVESQGIHDELLDYGDYDEKPLKRVSLHFGDGEDSISRDSLVDYTDGEEEFNEDGSFIGEYSGPKYKGSINEPNGLSTVTA
ncbi:transcript variant X3 [Nothobranchius furzeri]|uniref:Transcript variant X1 n=1 Tax=Nothobranchius furzeri TaxID=105023 RepID=A0A9D3BH01_NOTFU|nr:transcript variant X2 [Nothobranchius furzeri]KAF7209601.1 transcript variant X1 [Nothobranchius furzeri]KAF7209602.1 transcript variant X3 [Nothobranchius furzeri]